MHSQTCEALRLKPDLPEAHNELGSALLLAGQRDEGIAELREALRLEPNFEQAQQNLTHALGQAARGAQP